MQSKKIANKYHSILISISILVSISVLVSSAIFNYPANAQNVLQCAPGQATVSNNLVVNGNLQVNNNVAIRTFNPQVTLAIGDNDTGLRWNSDGDFSFMSNNTWELSIDPGNVRVKNNLCLGGSCLSSWPSSPTITLTGDVTGSGTTSIATTIPSGAVAWSELSAIPAAFADNTDNTGITSVPNCTATQKLTGSGGMPVCAPDIDTDTDSQTLSIVGSTLSISGGNSVALPATAEADTLDSVTGRGNTTANSISVGGLTITGSCVGGFIRVGTWCMGRGVNGDEGKILIKSVTSSGSLDYASGGWTILDIPPLNGTNAKFAILRAGCSEASIYLRRVGSTLNEGVSMSSATLACSAGNNSYDWESFRDLFIIELDNNKDIEWNLDANDPPTMMANLYLIGYID